MAISGAAFVEALERERLDFFSGVPCSLIEDAIATLERHGRLPWVATPREDVAVGLAGGAWFGGRRPAVLMQNSGLGTSLNAFASFSLMYGLPALLVVTWRGYEGKDAPEHILTGEITPRLLDLLGIPHRVPTAASLAADVAWAAAEMNRRMQPIAILVRPGIVEMGGVHSADYCSEGREHGTTAGGLPPPSGLRTPDLPHAPATLTATISRLAAITAARKPLGREPVVHANGYICRESFSVGDRPQNFYMIGSMGLASAIGLGLALARPDTPSVVFDGDGNLLMNLGVLPLVAALAPPNLVHVCFDNEVYGSTGNQRSISGDVRLDRVARAAGYRTATAVTDPDAVADAVRDGLPGPGPHFVLVKTTTDDASVPRLPFTPHELRDRFRTAVLGR
jgi:phosphonopyruvate decarboxylase